MIFYKGRLFDHIHLSVADISASRKFYESVIRSLGITTTITVGPGFFFIDELFVSEDVKSISQIHIAFQAKNKDVVEDFYRAALKYGGRENGSPGERSYHPGYFAAYVFDPDGNNVEAVYHGEATRSSDAITVVPVVG